MKLKKMVALLLALLMAMSLLTACGKTDNTKSDGDGKVTVNENGEWMPSGSVTLGCRRRSGYAGACACSRAG